MLSIIIHHNVDRITSLQGNVLLGLLSKYSYSHLAEQMAQLLVKFSIQLYSDNAFFATDLVLPVLSSITCWPRNSLICWPTHLTDKNGVYFVSSTCQINMLADNLVS